MDPSVISVSPGTGSEAGGDPVSIMGTGFGVGLTVFFGGSPAQLLTIDSQGEVIATSPAGAPGIAAITVSCDRTTFTPSPAIEFTYQAIAGSPVSSPDVATPSPSA
jgi:IPT/TIG domain